MSEQIKDGGPAFPHKLPRQDTSGVEASDFAFFGGMTLRDYFAAKVLQGFAADTQVTAGREKAAEFAYAWADAMIAARGEQS